MRREGRGKQRHVELRNRVVHFRVRDVCAPDPQQVINDLYSDAVVEGRVIDLSDGGPRGLVAVVSVEGLATPVIVAVDRLMSVL